MKLLKYRSTTNLPGVDDLVVVTGASVVAGLVGLALLVVVRSVVTGTLSRPPSVVEGTGGRGWLPEVRMRVMVERRG